MRSDLADHLQRLKEVPCPDCQQSYPHYVMDFDHVRREKLFNLARWKEYTNEEVLAEIEKCEVVCANCHRKRTWLRRVTIERYGFSW